MFTPRSVFVLLVLAQLVALSLGEILGTLKGAVILPLWRFLWRSNSILVIDGINIGAIVGMLLLSMAGLALGVLLLAGLMRVGWPWIARTLKIENQGS